MSDDAKNIVDFVNKPRAKRKSAKPRNGHPHPSEWWDHLLKSDNGKPIPNLQNAFVVLSEEPEFHGLFAYDEMLRAAILVRDFDSETDFKPRPLTDVDVGRMQ